MNESRTRDLTVKFLYNIIVTRTEIRLQYMYIATEKFKTLLYITLEFLSYYYIYRLSILNIYLRTFARNMGT